MPNLDFLSSTWFSTVCFLLGLLVGNRLAIGRDRRQEFNAIIERIRPLLRRHCNLPEHDQWLLISAMPKHKRHIVRNAIKAYHQAQDDCEPDGAGGRINRSPETVAKTANKLISHLQRR